jgi:hypothetical protein
MTHTQPTLLDQSSKLTPADIEFIQTMIDRRIQAAIHPLKPSQPLQTKNYHTAEEIRDLIRLHIDEFKGFVGDQAFSLEVLRCFLKRKTTLLPGDTDGLSSDKNYIRFDRQVANAVEHWPDCPFSKLTNRKSFYKVKQ